MRDLEPADLDDLLRRAGDVAPLDQADDQLFDDVWSVLHREIGEGTSGGVASTSIPQEQRLQLLADRAVVARRRRRALRTSAALLAVVLVGGGAAAAAEYLATRTGTYNDGWSIAAGGSGEFLDLGGTDLYEVVDELTADIPFPTGYEDQHNMALWMDVPTDPGSMMTTGNVCSRIAESAVCTWTDSWVAADAAGDTDARQKATEELRSAITWEPFVTMAKDAKEPAPTELVKPYSRYRWWVRPLAEAAETGDRAVLLAIFDKAKICREE